MALYFSPFVPAFNSNGFVMPGAQLRFRLTGTTTLTPVYSDTDLTTPLANPVTANASGRFPDIYLDDEVVYRVDFLDAAGGQLETLDPYTPLSSGGGGGGGGGEDGTDGQDAISGLLTNEAVLLPADATGAVTSYAPASGSFQVFSGSTNVSSAFSLSTPSGGNPQALTVGYVGQTYSVTGGFDTGETSATLTIRATGSGTFAGVTIDKTLSLGKAQPGATGAGSGGVDAVVFTVTREAIVFFTYADGTVVSFTNASGVAKLMQGQTDITSSATLSATASGCTGSINTATNTPVAAQPKGYYRITAMSADEATLTLNAVYNSVTYTKVVTFTKARAGYEIVSSLPATNLFEGRTVFLTTDDKLYRYTGASWTAATAAADITGQITTTQITDSAISTPKLAAGAVTTAKLTAGAVTANEISAGSITSAKLAASNVVTVTAQIADAIITGAKIADATIVAAKIADANITTAKINDAAVTTAKINDLSVTTLKIGNNSVTVPMTMTSGTTKVGNNGFQTVTSGSITVGAAGKIFAIATAMQSYSNVPPIQWWFRIKIAGVVVGVVGGSGDYTDSIAVSGSTDVAAGTHTVELEWQGGPAITLSNDTIYIQGAMK